LQRRRVAVIGLDGATWQLISRMIEFGAMPNTKRMLNSNDAAKGVLESSYPPVTPGAWASITTGVNPGKHGIFDFVHADPETGGQRLTTTLDLEHPRIYEMLAMQGIETLVFNPMPPYPLIPLKNLKIASSIFCPEPICHPSKMYRYCRNFPDYTERLDARKDKKSMDKDMFLELKLEKTFQRVKVIEDALKEESWSLAWIRLQDPDNMLHLAYDKVFSGHPKVIKIFTMLDKLVESSKQLVDLLVLVSDHGLRISKNAICINTILHNHAFAKLTTGQGLADQLEVMESIRVPGLEVHLNRAKTHIPFHILRILANSRLSFLTKLGNTVLRVTGRTYDLPRVDPLASEAYVPTPYSYGVFVRDASHVEGVRKALLSYTGIVNIRCREEVYWGPYVKRAPNLVIMVDHERGYRFGTIRISTRVYNHEERCDHHPYGIISFIGEDVAFGELGLVKAWDVAPTIMAYMGVPIPDDTDGRVLDGILNNATCEGKHYNYTSGWRMVKSETQLVYEHGKENGIAYSSEKEKELKERLRSLGYL